MSTYYSFYLGAKDAEGKMNIVGPYYYNMKEQETQLSTLFEASQSFIDHREFIDAMNVLPVEEIAEKDLVHLSTKDWAGTKLSSTSYYATLGTFRSLAQENNCGLYVGYAPLAEVGYVAEQHYELESKYDIELVSADMAAEMSPEERREYGKVAFVATTDTSYIAKQILDTAENLLQYVYGEEKNRYYILMTWG
jgi:hypothetical protein